MSSRLRDFLRMNPLIFLGYKENEDPQEFLDGVYKAELDSYKLRDVSQIWYTQWKDNRSEESGPIEWEEFKETFLGKCFSRKRREVKVEELSISIKAI